MGTQPDILRGASRAQAAEDAASELAEAIAQPDATTFVFASSRHDLKALGPALTRRIPGPVVGCTTAGEITPHGYARGSVVGFSIPRSVAEVKLFPIRNLDCISVMELSNVAGEAHDEVQRQRAQRPGVGAFGVLLVDGMSGAEEQVIGTIAPALPGIPVVGGSAGDDLRHAQAHVLVNGEFCSDTAVLALFTTERPFVPVRSQHFAPTETKLVITGARPEARLVTRIDGRPAAEAYAELVGCGVDELDDEIFSTHPLMLRVGGGYYVRSIRKARKDGSLSFYCAIDEGLVLTIARALDMVSTLDDCLTGAAEAVGVPELVIGFECIHRRLEAERRGRSEDIGRLFARNKVIGFHSYGEQADFIHINQTFTGVVLGEAPA